MPPLAVFINNIIAFIDHALVPLIFAIAFIVFIWGVFQYFIAGAANDEQQAKGKQFVMYGLIGFVVMIALWGIVNVLLASLGFANSARPNLPYFGSTGGTYSTGGTPIYGTNVTTGGTGSGGAQVQNACSSVANICFPWNHCSGGVCVPDSGQSTGNDNSAPGPSGGATGDNAAP